jgi:hypothetical protein
MNDARPVRCTPHAAGKADSAGQTIALACRCETVFTCHRRLLGDEMDRRGVTVEWD